MSVDSIPLFPVPELTKTEEDILLEIYKNSVVRKHLQVMALNDLVELAELSANRSKEDLAEAHATVRGKLSVIQTLLSTVVLAVNTTNKE